MAEVLTYQERNRPDALKQNFKVYRGLTLPQSEIDGFSYVANRSQAKGVEQKDWTFHLEGFTSTSFKREVAHEFATKYPSNDRKPVIFEYEVELSEPSSNSSKDQACYSGFRLNTPEYTAYPEEDEFLLPDGADAVIKEVETKVDAQGLEIVKIKVSVLNDWIWEK